MQYNLLKMTQLILSSMDSDEVNSIEDTAESTQVVDIIEQCYNDLISTIDYPDMWDLFELQPSNDPSRPTLMYLPENVAKIEWIQYDHAEITAPMKDSRIVYPMRRVTFFDRMRNLSTDQPEIYNYDLLVGSETFDVRGYNNKGPTYYTTCDNRTLIFDSYDASQGQTLIGNKTKCYGMKIPVFVRDDQFIPQFEPRQFTLFFNEAKSQCFAELKQVQNAKAEQRARRGWVNSQKHKPNMDGADIHDDWRSNFGRGYRGSSPRVRMH